MQSISYPSVHGSLLLEVCFVARLCLLHSIIFSFDLEIQITSRIVAFLMVSLIVSKKRKLIATQIILTIIEILSPLKPSKGPIRLHYPRGPLWLTMALLICMSKDAIPCLVAFISVEGMY